MCCCAKVKKGIAPCIILTPENRLQCIWKYVQKLKVTYIPEEPSSFVAPADANLDVNVVVSGLAQISRKLNDSFTICIDVGTLSKKLHTWNISSLSNL